MACQEHTEKVVIITGSQVTHWTMPRVHFKEQKVAPGHLALTFLISKPRPLASWDPEQVRLLLLGVGDFTVSHTVKERPDAQAGEAGLKDGLFGGTGKCTQPRQGDRKAGNAVWTTALQGEDTIA